VLQLDTITAANSAQVREMDVAQASQNYASVTQEVLRADSRRLVKLEDLVDKYTVVLREQYAQLETYSAALESAASQIQDLIDDNSKAEAELDANLSLIEQLKADLSKLQQTVNEKTREIEELKKLIPVDTVTPVPTPDQVPVPDVVGVNH
jgi:predicted RNase H-like nuclease (RuvC/YqgF family)